MSTISMKSDGVRWISTSGVCARVPCFFQESIARHGTPRPASSRRLGPRRSIGSVDAFPSLVGASTRPRVGCSNCCARKDAERNWIWWRRLLRRKGHRRFGEDGEPPKFAHAAGPWPQVVELALDEYYDHLKQLKADTRGRGWKLLDVAYRFKGNGSLGRLRFAALLGDDEERMLLELKEAAPSAIELARGTNTFLAQRARVQTAAIRRMQGDPWPRVAGTHLGKLPALGREIQPEEEKLRCARFAVAQDGSGHEQLIAYARQCGEVLGRLHCRVNAPAMLGAPWNALEAARSAVSFAESYAAVVEADWHAYVQARSRVAQELGV